METVYLYLLDGLKPRAAACGYSETFDLDGVHVIATFRDEQEAREHVIKNPDGTTKIKGNYILRSRPLL